MMDLFKTLDLKPTKNHIFLILSILLSLPTIVMGEKIIITFPILLIIMLSFIFEEKFIIAIIIISLFTLLGELDKTLRSLVHLVDFTLLGFIFLKTYGLDFRSFPQLPKSLLIFISLYFSVMILSSVLSKYPFAGVSLISQQLAFFVVAFVFYSLIKNVNDIKNYFDAIIIVSCIVVTVLIITFFNEGYDLVSIISKNRARVSALTGNIEAATNFIVVSFPIVIASLLLKKNFQKRKIFWFLLFYFIIGLTLAMSRSAIFGILISTSILFFILKRNLFYKLFLYLFSILLLFLLIQPLAEMTFFFFRVEEGLSAREQTWSLSLNIIRDHFLFGIGPGAYKYEMFNYFPYMLNDWWGQLFIYYHEVTNGANFSHNFFLTFFTDMGLMGLITAVTLPVLYFKISLSTLRKYKNESTEIYYLIVALFAAGVSIIARNFFNSIGLLFYGGITTDLPFWIIFGGLIYFYQAPLSVRNVINDPVLDS
jgi:O-antigen ligase